MIPVYVNVVSIAKNNESEEVFFSMCQDRPVRNEKDEIINVRETMCEVVMRDDVARKLYETLKRFYGEA